MDDEDELTPAVGVSEWWPWFAWYPVQDLDGHWRWLRRVECRLAYQRHYPPVGCDFEWQYRMPPAEGQASQ